MPSLLFSWCLRVFVAILRGVILSIRITRCYGKTQPAVGIHERQFRRILGPVRKLVEEIVLDRDKNGFVDRNGQLGREIEGERLDIAEYHQP